MNRLDEESEKIDILNQLERPVENQAEICSGWLWVTINFLTNYVCESDLSLEVRM